MILCPYWIVTGIVGLNNIKANDYCNVILQVCFPFPAFHTWSNVPKGFWLPFICRLCLMSLLWGTTSSRRAITRVSRGHPEIRCFCWLDALGSFCGSCGTLATSRHTSVHMRCCKQWCSAARRGSRSLSKVGASSKRAWNMLDWSAEACRGWWYLLFS